MTLQALGGPVATSGRGSHPSTEDGTGHSLARKVAHSRAALEACLVLVLYLGYSLSRLLADGSVAPATNRASELLGVERVLHLDWEHSLNHWFSTVDAAGLFGSYWYASAHYVVTAFVLVWLYRRSAVDYRAARTALVVATVIALATYLLIPTAPPRLSGGYVDVLDLHSAQGWWGADASAPRGLGGFTNELAALPSLHAGWALWVAVVLQRHARPPWRLLGWLHAGITALVVVGTGNHWVMDVVGGWAVVLLGLLVVRLASTASVASRLRTGGIRGAGRGRWWAQRVRRMTTPGEPHPAPQNPTAPDPSTFVARNPTDLVAVVPAVLGFHPQDSVVLLTFGPPGGAFHARVDLPVEAEEHGVVAGVLVDAVLANGVRRAAVLLYTDDVGVANAQAQVLVGRLLELGVDVIEVLRVDDGHWHPVPEDGSAGTAYELETHPFTAQRVFEGQVVHRDRAELADSLVGTDEDDAVQVALAATRFAELVATSKEANASFQGFLRTEARWLQGRIRSHVDDGEDNGDDRGQLDERDAGRLLVLASLVPTRDVAWAEITRDTSGPHVELWRDLVRRSPRELLPGPSSLLAFAAWQHGDGALAWCAIDRCLEVDPDYSMAHCVAEVLTRAVPPGVWEQIQEEELPVFQDVVPRHEPSDRAS